jgi:Cof subfamily protein (haloacid dehalogenase superfamily)
VVNLPEFEKAPNAVAIDVDGTLLDTSSKLSERNRKAMGSCIGCGVPVIIATSRPARSVRRLLGSELSDACSLVLMNGAMASGSPPLAGSYREIIPDEIARGVVGYALESEPEIRITIELDGYKFGVNWEVDYSILWQRNSATPDMVLSIEESLGLDLSKISLGGIGNRMLDLAEQLKKRYQDTISITYSSYGNPMLMITTAQTTKPNGIKKLLGSVNSSLENVVAIGDDVPDIEMLRECGISVAMANAIPEVKEVCAYSTASNDDDGVAIVLEKIVEAVK